MIPVVFINCKDIPFVDLIMKEKKTFETRNRNTLGALVGRRVLIAETGNGKPVVRCSIIISGAWKVEHKMIWDTSFREPACIPNGSKYDWDENTKCKWVYYISDVIPVSRFIPEGGKRHGRVWMEEYSGSEIMYKE